jgi:phosphoglycolate phosphatase-like HAD superfamily hydrolase
MIQLIIFDFDDTLVSNRNLDYKSFEIPCKKLSLIPLTKKDIKLSREKGFLATHVIKNYLKELNKKELFKKFVTERNNFLEQDQTNYLTTQKHTHELLQFLKKKKLQL